MGAPPELTALWGLSLSNSKGVQPNGLLAGIAGCSPSLFTGRDESLNLNVELVGHVH